MEKLIIIIKSEEVEGVGFPGYELTLETDAETLDDKLEIFKMAMKAAGHAEAIVDRISID